MYDKVPIHPLSSCGGPLQNQRAGSGDEGHLLHYTDCWGTTWDSVQRQILTFQNTFGNCTEWIKIRRKCRHPHHLTHRSAHSWSHLLIFCLKKRKEKKLLVDDYNNVCVIYSVYDWLMYYSYRVWRPSSKTGNQRPNTRQLTSTSLTVSETGQGGSAMIISTLM